MPEQLMSGGENPEDLVCRAPEGGASNDAEFWKSAPELKVPWPPLAESQSKFAVGWDKGPSFKWTSPAKTIPKKPKTLFEAPPVQVPTPVPGIVLDFFAKSEYQLKFSGEVSFALQKKGDEYSATASGKLSGTAEVSITGGIGVGVGGGGISAGVSGNLTGTVSLTLSAGVSAKLSTSGGKWKGNLELPLKAEGAIKVTPSASLYVKVWKWKKDLCTLKFGEWHIAYAGVEWTPGVQIDGKGFTNTTKKPKIIGPKWGGPPKAKEA